MLVMTTRLMIADPTGCPAYSDTFPSQPASAAGARRLTRLALATWQLDTITDDAVLVVTELVANAAALEPSRPMRVKVSRVEDHRVRIEVIDRHRRLLPEPRAAAEDAEGGRGLAVVDALADRWGYEKKRWGKSVWAELTVKDGAR